jgi:hypothetical protein
MQRPRVPRTVAGFFVCLLLALGSQRAEAQVVFSNSFSSCDGSGWDHVLGPTSYTSEGCENGCCGKKTLQQGMCDIDVYWGKRVAIVGTDIYVKGSWKFPTTWRFMGGGWCAESNMNQSEDFKAIIYEPIDGNPNRERVFLNFRTINSNGDGESTAANICFLTKDGWSCGGSGKPIRADGLWHDIEVFVRRVPGYGQLKVWLDGELIVDNQQARLCEATSCTPIVHVKVGAYPNWPSPREQGFYMDNITISTARIGDSNPEPDTVPDTPANLRRTDNQP